MSTGVIERAALLAELQAVVDARAAAGQCAPPRFAPERGAGYRTDGGRIARVAEAMGTPLLPWQRYVMDRATEYDPRHVDMATGRPTRWRYRRVVVTVPRQVGKTVGCRVLRVQRAFQTPRLQCFHTAQLGRTATDIWGEMVQAVLAAPVLARAVTTLRRSQGSQQLVFDNGSTIAPFAPGPKSMHSRSPHLVDVDEAWAFDAEDAQQLLDAVEPAMQTNSDRQLWFVSTQGDRRSAFLRQLIEDGRAGTDPETAYFEWSMTPGDDPLDPRSWLFHPGLGHLITMEDLDGFSRKPLPVFLRGFMNCENVASLNGPVDVGAFDALAVELAPPASEVAYAYDVAMDRSRASIWAAWTDSDGVTCLRPYLTQPGADWLDGEVTALVQSGARVYADDGGPARLVTANLHSAGLPVEVLPGRDAGTAWTALKAAITEGTLRHDGSPVLHDALEAAAENRRGDQVTLSRSRSSGPVDAAVAAMVAAWYSTRLTPLIQMA